MMTTGERRIGAREEREMSLRIERHEDNTWEVVECGPGDYFYRYASFFGPDSEAQAHRYAKIVAGPIHITMPARNIEEARR